MDVSGRYHFTVVPDRSAILVAVTTSLGPLTFGTTGLEGFVGAGLRDGEIDLTVPPTAHLEVEINELTSGNLAYDRELRRNVNARRFPLAYVDLHGAEPADDGSRNLTVAGEITFCGGIQAVQGRITVDLPEPSVLLVRGEEVFDIREFGIPAPRHFMIKIEPYVAIWLQVEARTGGSMHGEDRTSSSPGW